MHMKIDVSLFQKNDDKQQLWNAFLLASTNPELSQIHNVRYGVVHFDAFAHSTPLVIMLPSISEKKFLYTFHDFDCFCCVSYIMKTSPCNKDPLHPTFI